MKKWAKLILYICSGILLIIGCIVGYVYYQLEGKYDVNKEKYPHYVGHIDSSKDSSGFKRCDATRTFGWFASSATYGPIFRGSKATFKKYINHNFSKVDSIQNGFLNLRFIINCKGEVGNMRINELDKDYKSTKLSTKLVTQLVQLSSRKENWNIMVVDGENIDSYMYLIYKIENGEVVEILP